MAKGDCTSAVSNFRKALAAAPDNGLAGRDLVACLKKMGYNPSSPDTRIQLGDQLAAAGIRVISAKPGRFSLEDVFISVVEKARLKGKVGSED